MTNLARNLAAAFLLSTYAWSAPTKFANSAIELTFDTDATCDLIQIRDSARGVDFLAPAPEGVVDNRSLWTVILRGPNGRQSLLNTSYASSSRMTGTGLERTLVWTHVRDQVLQADLTVTVKVKLAESAGEARWGIRVEGTAAALLWEVHFPRVHGVRSFAESRLCVPQYVGRIARDPQAHRYQATMCYPQPLSMQYFAYWGVPERRSPKPPEEGPTEAGWMPYMGDATGLYWAAEDGRGFLKRFAVNAASTPGQLSWDIQHLPGLSTWPIAENMPVTSISYALPYSVTTAVFTGGMHEAAALYRVWAQQQRWCQRGTVDTWSDSPPPPGSDELGTWVPTWFREIGFWAKFYHEPAKVLPEWAAYRKWLRVPIASHYYRYTISRFDDNYNEMLPADPYFLQGMHAAKQLGVRPLPYINGVIWDTDTQSWLRENGVAAAYKDGTGEIYRWHIGDRVFAHMCPWTEQWQAKMRETTDKLVNEHGCAGVYLDCLAATRTRNCYDPAHGHTLRGGDYGAQGNRQLMRRLRAQTRRTTPDAAFFTEEINEQYVDVMDGFLTLDIGRANLRSGEIVYPVFSAVYHPYTINFGNDASIRSSADVFLRMYGLTFLWGCQPLISDATPPQPQAGDRASELLREITQAYTVAGKRFLQGGEWLPMTLAPASAKPSKASAELRAAPHTLAYTKRRGVKATWHGPAVMGSAWRRGQAIGVVALNMTDRKQTFTLALDAKRLGAAPGAKLFRTWPDIVALPGAAQRILALDANKVGIYVLAASKEEAVRGRGQLAEVDDWELLTSNGKPFTAIRKPAGTLWACDDAPVRNNCTPNATTASVDAVGRVDDAAGAAREGYGLPRQASEQPFLLLRRLPHTVQTQAAVTVLAGDERMLLCRVEGTASFTFRKPGVVVIDGLPRAIPANTTVEHGAKASPLVAYAAFDDLAASPLPSDLAGTLQTLAHTPTLDTAQNVGRAWAEALDKGRLQPSDFVQGALGRDMFERVRAVLCACVGDTPRLEVADDWLAPGIPKEIHARNRPIASVRLVPVLDKGVPFSVDSLAEPGAFLLTLEDGQYVERLVPLMGLATYETRAHRITVPSLVCLEANRPVELRTTSTPLKVVAGRSCTANVVLRNWSPTPVKLTVRATPKKGWKVLAKPTARAIPPLSDTSITLPLSVPPDTQPGCYDVRISVTGASKQEAELLGFVRVLVIPSITPVRQQAGNGKKGGQATLRQANRIALYAKKGQVIKFRIQNVRVTRYTNSLKYNLRDPDLNVLRSGKILVDKDRTHAVAAETTGIHFLEIDAGSGSAVVTVENPHVAEFATADAPLRLFCSNITRWFHVPQDANSFSLHAIDGGAMERVRFRIVSPTGRIALDRYGNWHKDQVNTIRPEPDEKGKLWMIRCEPDQDVAFWLEGDACGLLSEAPERTMRW